MRATAMKLLLLVFCPLILPAFDVSGFVASKVEGKLYLALNAQEYVTEGEEPDYGFQGVIGAKEVSEGGIRFQIPGVEPGEYIIQGFIDKNGNGNLDIGVFGPTEPYFFYRPGPVIFGPPDLKTVIFKVDRDIGDVFIEPLGG